MHIYGDNTEGMAQNAPTSLGHFRGLVLQDLNMASSHEGPFETAAETR